jgi:hypothetical protein
MLDNLLNRLNPDAAAALTHFFFKKNNRVQLQENKNDRTSVTLGIF